MADGVVTHTAARGGAVGVLERVRTTLVRMPPWLRVLGIYLVSRAVTTGMFLAASGESTSLSRFGADPSLMDFVLGWDARWYWYLATAGYPSVLPLTDAGEVAENAWAFMPVYAYLAQGIGVLLGGWGGGALLISLVSGYIACLLLRRILVGRAGESAALWSVVFLAAGPLSALFQVGYAEALFLVFLLLVIDGVQRRRYGALYLVIPVMAFTRPGVLAVALFLGLMLVVRWFRRATEPLPVKEAAHLIALAGIATLTGFAWQVIAAIVTGDPGAYLATELAWRRNWSSGETGSFIPFDGWITASQFWFSFWGLPAVLGLLALVVLVVLFALLLFSARVRRLGPEILLWSASYALYLLAVFFPQSSTLRLLFPLTPLWGAVPRRNSVRIVVLILCLVVQGLWIREMYGWGDTFWRVP